MGRIEYLAESSVTWAAPGEDLSIDDLEQLSEKNHLEIGNSICKQTTNLMMW